MAEDDNDLGFGHFSTAKTENDWKHRSYDGLESSSPSLRPINTKELYEMLEKLKLLKKT